MVKALMCLVLGSMMFAATANADAIRLATRPAQDGEMIIDFPQDVCNLNAVSVVTGGATFWINEVTVAYRAPQVTRDRFVTNRVSSTGWLNLKKKGLCVRRVYLKLEQTGSTISPTPTVTIYGM